jgi:hypothetical protein
MTTSPIPIVCDMTDAPDTAVARIAEYRQLFLSPDFIGRTRTEGGVRFRFHARPELADQIRDLAAREKACCAFFDFVITEHDDEITWDASVVDDPMARIVLDEYYELPETAPESVEALHERFAERGLTIVIDDNGVRRPATPAELGLAT